MKNLRNLDTFEVKHLFEESEFGTVGPSSVTVSVSFLNRSVDKRRRAAYVFDAVFACARCLKEVPIQYRGEFECELTGEDDEVIAVLVESVLQEVAIGIPMRHLCDESCRGLCRCGADLNSEPCRCGESEIDSRLEILKSWIK